MKDTNSDYILRINLQITNGRKLWSVSLTGTKTWGRTLFLIDRIDPPFFDVASFTDTIKTFDNFDHVMDDAIRSLEQHKKEI